MVDRNALIEAKLLIANHEKCNCFITYDSYHALKQQLNNEKYRDHLEIEVYFLTETKIIKGLFLCRRDDFIALSYVRECT